MKVAECMTGDVKLANPEDSIQQAARIMASEDIGVLPVAEGDRLVGMITDRDIAVRAVADGHGCDTKVSEVMTREVRYCFDDEDTEDVMINMGDQQLRRLPVVDRDKRLVGMLSLSDCTMGDADRQTGEALQQITRPGGQHSQALH
jgi:CBS domain-containing protein